MPEVFFNWIGHFGAAGYVAAYALLQLGVIRGSGYVYALMNLVASSCVMVSLMVWFNMSAVLLNGAWIAISLMGLTRIVILDQRSRLTKEEADFIGNAFPDLTRAMARRFLDAGAWVDFTPDTVLTEEGRPVDALVYISDGCVEATCGGTEIGTVDRGFIGEINVLSGGPASATTTIRSETRGFVISRAALVRLCQRDPEFRLIISHDLGRDTGRKLVHANARNSTQRNAM